MSNHDHLPHPMQPVYLDESGAARFKPNAIIRYLFDSRRLDLNEIAALPFSPEDRMQIAQLLGFTMVGYGEIPYVSDQSYEAANEAAEALIPANPGTG